MLSELIGKKVDVQYEASTHIRTGMLVAVDYNANPTMIKLEIEPFSNFKAKTVILPFSEIQEMKISKDEE